MIIPKANNIQDTAETTRLLNLQAAASYIGLGATTARRFLKEIGAEIKIGRRSLFDKSKIDNYLDQLTEQ